MNMMSPVSWALSFGYLEAVKKLIESFKIFASISEKEFVQQHAPIFYSFVKQVLDLGLINLDEFLNPTQTNSHEGLQLFEMTLSESYLPACHGDTNTFINSFYSNINKFQAHLEETLEVDQIAHPGNCSGAAAQQLFEVQYSYIDMSWIDILNRFNQESPAAMSRKQLTQSKDKEKDKSQLLQQYDYSKLSAQDQNLDLLKVINTHPRIELLTCESVKILIDLRWNKYAKSFFDA
jgi:hypothetical protein